MKVSTVGDGGILWGMEVCKEVKLSMGTKVFSRNGVKCHRHNTYRGMQRHVCEYESDTRHRHTHGGMTVYRYNTGYFYAVGDGGMQWRYRVGDRYIVGDGGILFHTKTIQLEWCYTLEHEPIQWGIKLCSEG